MSKSPKNMKKLLPKRKPERKPSEEDFTVRKSKYATHQLKYTTLMVKGNFALKLLKKAVQFLHSLFDNVSF